VYQVSSYLIVVHVSEIVSKFERIIGYFTELRLRELVPQSRDELRVDLHTEGFYFFNCG
jgi:hypothetical protein